MRMQYYSCLLVIVFMIQAKKHKIVAPTLKGENIQSPFRDLGLKSVAKESKEITKEGFLENRPAHKEDKVALLGYRITLKEHCLSYLEHLITLKGNRISLLDHSITLKENRISLFNHSIALKEHSIGYFVMPACRQGRFSVRKIKNQSIFIV